MGDSQPYPSINRVVTGHTKDGKSIVLHDEPLSSRLYKPNSVARCTEIYRAEEHPPSNGLDYVDTVKEIHTSFVGAGSALWSFEMPPGEKSFFHRTVTLDYGIVIKGTITLELDEGPPLEFKAGDVIIQRGTAHLWRNNGNEWTQVYFFILPAEKVKVGEKELEEDFAVPH